MIAPPTVRRLQAAQPGPSAAAHQAVAAAARNTWPPMINVSSKLCDTHTHTVYWARQAATAAVDHEL